MEKEKIDVMLKIDLSSSIHAYMEEKLRNDGSPEGYSALCYFEGQIDSAKFEIKIKYENPDYEPLIQDLIKELLVCEYVGNVTEKEIRDNILDLLK